MKKAIQTTMTIIILLFTSNAFSADTIYCANKKHGTELYIKDGKTLSFVNLAEDGLALVNYTDMFVTSSDVSLSHDDDGHREFYTIQAQIEDHNFEWEVTADVNVKDREIQIHMIDNDSYDYSYYYTLKCDKVLNIR